MGFLGTNSVCNFHGDHDADADAVYRKWQLLFNILLFFLIRILRIWCDLLIRILKILFDLLIRRCNFFNSAPRCSAVQRHNVVPQLLSLQKENGD